MSMSEKENKNSFPKFIIDKPEGKDLFEGQSQNRIAENIKQFIVENSNSTRRVIGIDGEWGSGKSNVIEILKTKLKEGFYFFIFDAWGHQEDLKRRSILEELLNKLVNVDKILSGKSKNKKTWEEELKELLARKKETVQKTVPKISPALVLSLLAILFLPVSKFGSEQYLKYLADSKIPIVYSDYLIASVILTLPLIPFLVYIICVLVKARFKNSLKIISELFYVFRGKEIQNTSTETISENEPSVREFSNFLSDIELHLEKNLVIVFDNMDRLPARKVKEIWSSIHTFFASEESFLQTWAIVPFDNVHICNIFKEDDNQSKLRADSYIHKTFSIVFHVSPPVLSDWKSFLYSKFKEAFGFELPVDQQIDIIFDYHHLRSPKIKPRDIICYINDIVALRKLWGEEIDLKYLALFALKQNDILENPFDKILTRDYLGELSALFEFDDKLETNVSALAFNVPLDIADEILIKRPIENALKGEGDFSRVYNHKAFFPILDSVFYNTNPNVLHTINVLGMLPENIRGKSEMFKYWEKLSDSILKIDKFDLKYVDAIKKLMLRLESKTTSERLLKYLFKKAVSLNEENQKYYSGSKYFDLVIEIEELLKSSNKTLQVPSLLPENNVAADEFLQFVKACPDRFHILNLKCSEKDINNYLGGEFDNNGISKYFEQLVILKTRISFEALIDHIKKIIPTFSTGIPNYQVVLGNIFEIGKIFSEKEKFLFVFPEKVASTLLTADPSLKNAVDLLLLIIRSNIATPKNEHLNVPVCKKMLSEETHNLAFVESYKFYLTYSDLIRYQLKFPSILVKKVINTVTAANTEVSGKNTKDFVEKYVEIKSSIFDNELAMCASFVSKLDSFGNESNTNYVSEESCLPYIIPFIQDNSSLNNVLVNKVKQQANEYVNGLSEELWVSSLKDFNKSKNIELFVLLTSLYPTQYKKLPEKFSNAYLSAIRLISKETIAVPNDYDFWNTLFSKVNEVKLITTFKDVRDDLLNHNHSDLSINDLLFFENGLFKLERLEYNNEVADDTIRRILIPAAVDSDKYMNFLKRNEKKMIEIIERANESVLAFRDALESKCGRIFQDTELQKFIERLNERHNQILPKLPTEENELDSADSSTGNS